MQICEDKSPKDRWTRRPDAFLTAKPRSTRHDRQCAGSETSLKHQVARRIRLKPESGEVAEGPIRLSGFGGRKLRPKKRSLQREAGVAQRQRQVDGTGRIVELVVALSEETT
jgi:hypothetical protein